ncbi:MAG: cohesin domain-containing protein [Euryarchaeota archaeon]|nr:cohesin domain-containing protein [Euryarchaeota archaeon]
MEKRTTLSIMSGVLIMLLFAASASSAPNTAYLYPQDIIVPDGYGNTTTVLLKLNATDGIACWQTDIYFDSECVNITDVDFTGSPFDTLPMWGHYGDHIRASSMMLLSTIAGDDLLLATITVRCNCSECDYCESNLAFTGSLVGDDHGVNKSSEWLDGTVSCGIADTTPPVISNVANSVPTADTITITWETDEASDSRVMYGTEPGNYVAEGYDAAMVASHSIVLTGLSPETTYYFIVDSTDASGNSVEGVESDFKTAASPAPQTVTVSIDDVTIAPKEMIAVPVTIRDVTALGGCAINIVYNASIVDVTGVTAGEMAILAYNINDGTGWMYASAVDAEGLDGDVVFAHINLVAVGTSGDVSPLNLTVEELFDVTYTPIDHTVVDGSVTIKMPPDIDPPIVSDASVSRDTILNDNGRPRAPGTNTTVIEVTATDADTGVLSVTIDLSQIGGSDAQPMERISGTDTWTVTTNASDGVNLTHRLVINATDNSGNHNDSVGVTLTVLRRGDVCRDNVIDSRDVLYIARYLASLEPEASSPPDAMVGDVVAISGDAEGDGIVDMADVVYLMRCVSGLEDEP